MRQVRLSAISRSVRAGFAKKTTLVYAPVLVAIFSGQPLLASPVSLVRPVTGVSSSLISAEFPQPESVFGSEGNLWAQASPSPSPTESPTPSPSPESSPEPSPLPTEQPSPSPTSSPSPNGVILQQQGELAPGDSLLPTDNSLYDEYTFAGRAGQTINITVESADFDTYLAVFNAQGELIAEHDDISQQNSNSAITVTLPVAGNYRVIVNAYDEKGRGKYVLTIR